MYCLYSVMQGISLGSSPARKKHRGVLPNPVIAGQIRFLIKISVFSIDTNGTTYW